MRKGALLTILTCLFFAAAHAAGNTDACTQLQMLNAAFKKYHYQPLVVNRDWSEAVFDKWIRQMDPYRYYFTKADLAALDKYRTNFSLYINNNDCSFLEAVQSTFKAAVKRSDSMSTRILSAPLQYTLKDTIHFSYYDTFSYVKDAAALYDWLLRTLKYRAIQAMYRPKDTLDKPFEKEPLKVLEAEPEVRRRLLQKTSRRNEQLLKPDGGLAAWICNSLKDAIALCHDPHSGFFTQQDLKQFEDEMSAKALSFGIYFDDSQSQEVEIVKVVPGGPAWKSNQVQKGDVMVQVQFPGKKPIDLTDADADEVDKVFGENPAPKMELVVRKPNGQVRSVHLQKEEMPVDENAIKSYVLHGDKTIGYISLPGFYTDMENGGGQGCANDVAREIVKLQRENIEGLIFDLRFNGGGSIDEVLQLAGLFIEDGPVCITRDAKHQLQVMKSYYRGSGYKGPLVVMVNGLSASASEIFAAAIRDHHRGIIVGSTTYGKATGQFFWPVSPEGANRKKPDESLGYVKATAEKFYHLDGTSHQLKGLVPDVVLPEFYDNLVPKEAEEPFALPNDTVYKPVTFTAFDPLPVEALAISSRSRTAANPAFKAVAAISDTFLYFKSHEQHLVLTPQHYVQFIKAEQAGRDSLDKRFDEAKVVFIPAFNKYDVEVANAAGKGAVMADADLLKEVKKDIYIDESYRIMCELLRKK